MMMPTTTGAGIRGERAGRSTVGAGPDAFGRLVGVMKENERLLLELELLNARLGMARASLAGRAGPRALVLAHVAHLKSRRAGLVARLRANRIAAGRILEASDGARAPEGP